MNVTDERLAIWAKPLSDTEDAKAVNAEKQITEAVRVKFGDNVRVFLQGSYANDTNVRQDSDIDVVVEYKQHFYPDVSRLQSAEQHAYWSTFTPATYRFEQFRDDMHAALNEAFPGSVELGEKCFKINGNTTRMNADVIACYEHHQHSSATTIQHKGITFQTRTNGTQINSFPEQHRVNGEVKNNTTGKAYKQMVRILKNIRTELLDAGEVEADPMSSFFIESLVWNVANPHFNGTTFRSVAREVVKKIWNDMRNPTIAATYHEVSSISPLFSGPKYTSAQAEAFMLKAWNYLEP